MNQTAVVAFVLAGGLILLGGVTGWFQVRGLRTLAARSHVPSDEFAYLRRRGRRRLAVGGLLVVIGSLIAGAYLSGLEPNIDALTQKDPNAPPPAADTPEPKKEMTPDQKQLVRVWGAYWAVVVVLVFLVMGLAFADALATRRYALQQYQLIREDHEAKLRRDLAVYRAQKEANRGGRGGNRLGLGNDDTPPEV